jgi:hypothetical protein
MPRPNEGDQDMATDPDVESKLDEARLALLEAILGHTKRGATPSLILQLAEGYARLTSPGSRHSGN